MSESRPEVMRATIFLPVSGLISPCRACPHQISTSQGSRVAADSPWWGSSSPTERTAKPPRDFRQAAILIAEEVVVCLLLPGLPLVPYHDPDGPLIHGTDGTHT